MNADPLPLHLEDDVNPQEALLEEAVARVRSGRRKIGEWSPAHPGTRVERVKAAPRERPGPVFAPDADGNPRRVEPDNPGRALRRARGRAARREGR